MHACTVSPSNNLYFLALNPPVPLVLFVNLASPTLVASLLFLKAFDLCYYAEIHFDVAGVVGIYASALQ